MKLLLATNHLGLGGSESYLLTVAEQLDRLGHEVLLYAPERGRGVEAAQERAVSLIDATELSDDFDAALVQDAGTSYELADRCPGVRQVFVAHSETFDLQAPPQLPGIVGTVVALNDRVAARMRSYGLDLDVERLRQPIDTERFTPRGALPATAGKALLLSNTPNADRLAMLEEACARAGLELTRVGGLSSSAADIRPALDAAQIVIGYGRSILEAMACGRAAYVYDWNGGDGWVTPDSYAAIEADGIGGRSGRQVLDADKLVDDLRRYSASMGPVNHDLVIAHHRANVHAQQLLGLFEREPRPAARPPAPLQEMARLVRLEWRARVDVHLLAEENAHLRGLLAESERKAMAARDEALRDERRLAEAVETYESSRSWRVTRPLRALLALPGRVRRLRASLSRAGRRARPAAAGPGSDGTTNGAGSPPPSRGADREKAPPG